jgi:hypothetical protein
VLQDGIPATVVSSILILGTHHELVIVCGTALVILVANGRIDVISWLVMRLACLVHRYIAAQMRCQLERSVLPGSCCLYGNLLVGRYVVGERGQWQSAEGTEQKKEQADGSEIPGVGSPWVTARITFGTVVPGFFDG